MSSISDAAEILLSSHYPVILTGAGISAESGIPTFRGEDGLWKKHRPEELASPEAFQRDPKLVWEWYNWRKDLIASKKPNAAHFAISRLEKLKSNMVLITQNVDDLHRKSGIKNILEMHGNIFRVRCTKCGKKDTLLNTDTTSPICSYCKGPLRPDIVWFGEMLDSLIMSKIDAALYNGDVLLIIGTSGVVYPAAGFADSFILKGKKVIEINIEPNSRNSETYLHLTGKAGDILPQILNQMEERKI